MKLKYIITSICLLIAFSLDAQDEVQKETKVKFGVKAGYILATAKVKIEAEGESATASDDQGGFTFGVFSEVPISEKVSIEPGVNYASLDGEEWLFIPVNLKYYVVENFAVLGGLQGSLTLEPIYEYFDRFGLDFTFGASYNIIDDFFIEARYALELSDRTPGGIDLTGDDLFPKIDAKTKINSLFITLGYRF